MTTLAAKPKRLGADLAIFPAMPYVDVFYGTHDWEPHARFHVKRTRNGAFVTQVSGERVPSAVFKQVINKVNK